MPAAPVAPDHSLTPSSKVRGHSLMSSSGTRYLHHVEKFATEQDAASGFLLIVIWLRQERTIINE